MDSYSNFCRTQREGVRSTKSIMIMSSKLIFSLIIMDVWIKALFNISGGSIYSVYKDVFIIVLLTLLTGFAVVNPKNIVRNKIDLFVLFYTLYAIFELVWTYYNAGSFIIGAVRFRLYFLVFFLYFYFRYLSLSYFDYMPRMLSFAYKVIAVVFVWTILEFLLMSLDLVTPKEIASFLERGSGVLTTYSYNLGDFGIFHRGLGVAASALLNGVVCVTGLAMVMFSDPHDRHNVARRLLLIAGFVAVILSGAKTAWLLLLVIVMMMGIYSKSRSLYLSIALVMSVAGFVVYKNIGSISGSVDATIFKAIPLYYFSLVDFIDNATFSQVLLGGGYSIHQNAFAKYGVEIINQNALVVGNEVFLIEIFKQFGVVFVLLYLIGFIYIPLMVSINKRIDAPVRGAALAVLIAGVSSIHYNAIFRSGVNMLVVFGLAYLSYGLDRQRSVRAVVGVDAVKWNK